MTKVVHKNFVKLRGKHMSLSLIFIKVTGWVTGTSSKRRLRHSYFPVSFTKYLRTPFS